MSEQIQSDINFAMLTSDSNDLWRLRRHAHTMTPEQIKEIIDALTDHAEIIDSKNDKIAGLHEALDAFKEIAEGMREEFEMLKTNIEELKKSAKTSEIVEEAVELVKGFKTNIDDMDEVIEDYKI